MSTLWIRTVLAAVVGVICASASAQPYPNRTVRVIVPFAAGSTVDVAGRMMVDDLRAVLGGVWVVENRPGQVGVVGTGQVAKSKPDGYTLVVSGGSHFSAAPWMFKSIGYDPVTDFAHIGRWNLLKYALVINPEIPAKNLREFLSYVKASPAELAYGYGSSSSQLGAISLATAMGFKGWGVAYKSQPQSLIDVVEGRIQYMVADVGIAVPYMKSGRIRAIAVTSADRSDMMPEVPTAKEQGVPDYDYSTWIGLSAPAGTPPEILERINSAMHEAMKKDKAKDRYLAIGLDVSLNSVADQARYVQEQLAAWGRYVKEANITPQ